MKDLDFNFPLDNFEKLIIDIGWESLDDWLNFWNNQRNILSIERIFFLLFQKLNQSSKDSQPISIINFSNLSRGKLISKSFIFLT